MWERAIIALRECVTFTVFGFSFPTSDCFRVRQLYEMRFVTT